MKTERFSDRGSERNRRHCTDVLAAPGDFTIDALAARAYETIPTFEIFFAH